jgi:integrase
VISPKLAQTSRFLNRCRSSRWFNYRGEDEEVRVGLAVVRDLRERRAPANAEEIAEFETDVLSGFVLARSAAGLADSTIRSDVTNLEQVRAWFGRPLWEMEPSDADAYFGKALASSARNTRLARAQTLTVYFQFLELRHKVEIHAMTGYVVECPLDEINRPRGQQRASLRIPPSAEQVDRLFAGWRQDLVACRKFAPTARNFAAARLMADVGIRVNEARSLDLSDIKWDLGRFGKLHVRKGKGTRGSGPRERMVPLINNAGRTLRWFVEDVWATSTTITTGMAHRCSHPSATTPTARQPGSAARRCAPRWPRPPYGTCRTGRTNSPHTCCGTSAPASSTWAART